MKITYTICLLFLTIHIFAQIQIIDSIPANGTLLNSGWKFHAGDNQEWAKQDFNDKSWQSVSLSDYSSYLSQLKNNSIGWFRLHVILASSLQQKQLAIQITQLGASEIYLNGKLFQRLGSIRTSSKYESLNPVDKPFLLPPNTSDSLTIAIRFDGYVPQNISLFINSNSHKTPLVVTINSWNNALSNYEINSEYVNNQTKLSYLFVALAFLFILLYIFFPKEKINLLFGALCFFSVTRSLVAYHLLQGNLDISKFGITSLLLDLNDLLEGILILSIICQAVLNRIPFYYRVMFLGMCIEELLFLIFGPTELQLIFRFTIHVLVTASFFYLGVLAFTKKNFIIGIVAFNCGLLNLTFFLFSFHISLKLLNALTLNDYVRYVMTVNFIMITIYIAINFARKSRNLEIQLAEIDKLSKENLEKEQEKQQLLASQNNMLEQQVTERTAELNNSLNELKSTQAQLIQSEKMASLGELTAGIAHEIQNPLNFVNNFSEVNKEMVDEATEEIDKGNMEEVKNILNDIKANSEKISHHGRRADAIVKGMLQHSRQTSGTKEPTDINALCDEYLKLSYHGLRAKDKSFNVDFKTDFDESIGKINVVPQDIGRVLLNLYNNAFYAVNEKKKTAGESYQPTILVQTKKLADKVEIIVSDNGNGIPQKIVDKIFQPFFTTKPTGHGTGLGLSLSYDIIKAHGGEIEVETKGGEGTEFKMIIPSEKNQL